MLAMTASELLNGYVELRQQVAIMLELARTGEWEALIERQPGYLQLVDRLRRLDAGADLDHDTAERKAELLETILADDLAIRERLMERRSELSQMMGSSRRQRDLHRSYGKQAVSPGNMRNPETP